MQTLTEIVAAVVVHSSAAAYSHFGVTVDAHQLPPAPAAERTVARTSPAKPMDAPAAKIDPTAAKLARTPLKT